MTPQLTEILTGAVLHLGIASFFAWWLVRSLRSSGLSGWWFLPVILIALFLKWYIGVPLIIVFLMWLESRSPTKQSTESNVTGRAYRLGERISRLLPKRSEIIAPDTPQLSFGKSTVWNLKKGCAALAFAAIASGIGYITRFEYFKNPVGATLRTNRWTDETDVLSNGGWRVLQTHEQWATEQWMENHPGGIPPGAKPWVYSHAHCSDDTETDCEVYANTVDTMANSAVRQWIVKYEQENAFDEWIVTVPQPPGADLPPPQPIPTPKPQAQ